MTPYEKLKTARASTRPTGSAYVNQIFKNIIELHGDRRYGDDAAIYSGIGYLDENTPATFIAIDKAKAGGLQKSIKTYEAGRKVP